MDKNRFAFRVKGFQKRNKNVDVLSFKFIDEKYFRPSVPIKWPNRIIRDFKDMRIGKIYTWSYYEPVTMDSLLFYDIHPVVLFCKTWFCENTGNRIIEGINLNFIPPKIRLQIMDIIHTKSKLIYQKDKTTKPPERGIIYPKDDYWDYLNLIIDKLVHTGYKFAIRRYIYKPKDAKLIQNIIMIPQAHWKYVASLNTYFLGRKGKKLIWKNIFDVYKEFQKFYLKQSNQKSKKKRN